MIKSDNNMEDLKLALFIILVNRDSSYSTALMSV